MFSCCLNKSSAAGSLEKLYGSAMIVDAAFGITAVVVAAVGVTGVVVSVTDAVADAVVT